MSARRLYRSARGLPQLKVVGSSRKKVKDQRSYIIWRHEVDLLNRY